ncbi:long-chain-fatty-acid--CoA ligase [Phenylobacterium sp.]|uniref:long-chain-fatty-acid--CoA ligase n=1 Tax=Phenylobacterium sp. TaxID=1871053 RepID=UPI002FDFAD5E
MTLADIPRLQAARNPDRTAFVDGGEPLDYATLDRRASQVANGLLADGTGPQERVAILARNGSAFCEVLLGCLKAGAVALPVNWRLSAPEIGFILRHAGVKRLFHAEEFAPAARAAAEAAGLAWTIALDGPSAEYATWRAAQSERDPQRPVSPDDTALQMYTSGTTGLPKGVQLTHRGYLVALALVQRFAWGRLGPEDVVLAPAPFFHINGVNPVLRTFAAGGCVVAPPQFDAQAILSLIEQRRVTRTTLAPAMIQACLEVPDAGTRDLSSLQVISYGGSPIAEAVLRRATRLFGCEFVQMYGLTETNGPVTFLQPEDHAEGAARLLSCGRPAGGVELQVTDGEGRPVPAGEVGEIRVRTPALMKGYWRDEAATAEVIEDGWFRTGDAGYLDPQGYLHIHDRVKDMIVSGGENIYPAEVENALFGHPAVADVAVIGVPDPKWGEAVKALVVRRPGATVAEAELIAHARERLAGYKLPKSVSWIDAVPRNAAGKILRRELREPYWAGAARKVG